MNLKLFLIIFLLFFLCLSNISAKTQTITTDIKIGNAISVHPPDIKIGNIITFHDPDQDTGNKGVYINEVCIWCVKDQCSWIWISNWLNKLLVDLRNQGFINGEKFVKTGHFEKEYEWRSGFFNQNIQKTVFIFNINE